MRTILYTRLVEKGVVIAGTVLGDLVLISIWAATTTFLISHVMLNTAGGRVCGGEGDDCRKSLFLLGMSVGQNMLCVIGLVLSAERVGDRENDHTKETISIV